MRQRSSYPKSFKAQVVQKCLQPGATISGVAIPEAMRSYGWILRLPQRRLEDPGGWHVAERVS
jgi:transposase